MKIRCENCEEGPCTASSDKLLWTEQMCQYIQKRCFWSTTDRADWKEIAPNPWKIDPEKEKQADKIKERLGFKKSQMETTMEAIENVTIKIKYPVEAEFLEAAFWLEQAIKDDHKIDILASAGPRENLVCSSVCDYYFPKSWIFASPAEPKVLTATDIWMKVRKNAGEYEHYRSDDIDYAIDLSRENGRLERDLELRPVIEASLELSRQIKSNPFSVDIDVINNLLGGIKKLKPLN